MGYGRSIALDDSGDFLFNKNTNGFAMCTDEDNFVQAMRILLNTITGELRLYPTFGVNYPQLLSKDISDDNIAHAVKTALSKDPRVQRVQSVSVTRQNRSINISVTLSTNQSASLTLSEELIW